VLYTAVVTREYHYRVDRDGRIFHDDTEIIDPATVRFFVRAMTRTPDGRWLVVCQGEHNWFAADATPLVARRLDLDVRDGRLVRASLRLAADVAEPLDPATLHTDGRDVFCLAGRGRHPVRLGRLAAQQLAPFLADHGATVHLRLGERWWPVVAAAAGQPAFGGS
jgi:hypothetical protein